VTENLRSYLDFAVETAYLAGRLTLGYFQSGIRPDMKPNDTPVTIADKKSEELIRKRIEEYYPTHAIIGEEYGKTNAENASHRWYIDPIDGTKAFVRGIPTYSILIGLEIEGKMSTGVIYLPALDEMVDAALGEGCWWNGRRAWVSNLTSLKQGLFVSSISDLTPLRQDGVWNIIKERTYHQGGSWDAFGYALVATGRAELIMDTGMEDWDCAPYSPIFTEAGGYFGDWDGNPKGYGKNMMATTQKLLPEALELARAIQEISLIP